MAYTKAGIRFSRDSYVEVDAENPGMLTGFNVDMRQFPNTMSAGMTAQIIASAPEGGKFKYSSNASNTKISVDENGLMTCIGSTTGACNITIQGCASDDTVIFAIVKRIEVV